MTETWLLAAFWFGLALLATLLSIWLSSATALSEIVVGTVAQLIIGATIGTALLHTDDSWVKFLFGTGAIALTFLASAELDSLVFRTKWREASTIGLIGFAIPFLGCAALAYCTGARTPADSRASLWQNSPGACFTHDLATALALGFIFGPFTWKTAVFFGGSMVALVALRFVTSYFFKRYGNRPLELEASSCCWHCLRCAG